MSAGSQKSVSRRVAAVLLGACCMSLLAVSSVSAQQTTGTPGAPSATTTVDGNYLPNTPSAFGGEIDLDAKDDARMAKVLTEDEARRMASNMAKLPTLLAKGG